MSVLDQSEEERRRAEDAALAAAVAEQAPGRNDVRLPARDDFPAYRESGPGRPPAPVPDLTPRHAIRRLAPAPPVPGQESPGRSDALAMLARAREGRAWGDEPLHDFTQADAAGRPIDMHPKMAGIKRLAPPPAAAGITAPLPFARSAKVAEGPQDIGGDSGAPPEPDLLSGVRRLTPQALALTATPPPAGTAGDVPEPPVPDALSGKDRTPIVPRFASGGPAVPGAAGDEPKAPASAPGRPSPLAGPVERFLQDWGGAMTQQRLKPNYGAANRLDALATPKPLDPTKALQNQKLALEIAKLQGPEKPHENDALAVAKYLHPNPGAPTPEKAPSAKDVALTEKARAETQGIKDKAAAERTAIEFPFPGKEPLPPKPAKTQKEIDDESAALIAARGRQGKSGGGASGADWDPAAVSFAAKKLFAGQPVPLGRGDGFRQAVFAEVENLAKDAGVTAVGNAADVSADRGALATGERTATALAGFHETAKANMKLVRDTMANIDQSDYPFINKGKNFVSQNIKSDPARNLFLNALKNISKEYAKLTTFSLGNQGITDAAAASTNEMLNNAMSDGSLDSVLTQIDQEMENRRKGVNAPLDATRARLGSAPRAPEGATPAEPEIRERGGKKYRRVPGGWEEVE